MSNEDEFLALILVELRETRRLLETFALQQPGVKPAEAVHKVPAKKPAARKKA